MSPSGPRTPLIAGNWKMYKTVAEAEEFIQALLPRVSIADGVDVAICPGFLALEAMVDSTRGSRVQVYAQNMHQAPEGAFTGEVSAVDAHRDRRPRGDPRPFRAPRELRRDRPGAGAKVPAALEAGLLPILCVGETEEERERGDTERKLRHQVQEDLAKVEIERLGDVVIAYEPIWAIGTGLVATPEQAQEALAFIRALVADRSREQAARTRVLYGGSVKAENAAELLALPDVDGALVGGASLDPESFAAIVAACRPMTLPDRASGAIPAASAALIVLDGWGLAPAGRATPCRWPTPPCSTSCGTPIRTRSSPRAAGRSACPRARWATRRSATSTSAPARWSCRT